MVPVGNLYVIAAPSGTGKTTLVQAVVDSLPNLVVSISHTTRPKRPLEKDGVNYYFIDKTEFQRMLDHHDFLEHAVVFDHFYGTSRRWVEQTLSKGVDVILEIDWQGCQQIRALFPDCISIFILPPSLDDLALRLTKRSQESPDKIQSRLMDAHKTLNHIHEFDYVVINADFNHAVEDLQCIVLAGRLLQPKQTIKYAKLLANFTKNGKI